MKKFINKLIHSINSPIRKIKHYHELIIQIEEDNPYRMLLYWLLDVIQYGFIVWFIYISLIVENSIIKIMMLFFAFGMLRWLIIDTIKEIANIWKEN
jgi:hypothetical protein